MGLFDWLKPDEPEPTPEPSSAPTTADIEAGLQKAEQMVIDHGAPMPVLARTLRITTMTKAILPRIANLGMNSSEAYTVVATAMNYLPESLASYVNLPRDWADTRPVANGKSSLLMLVDQLDLLSLTMSRMYDAVNRRDAGDLVAQGAFLQAKFGGPPSQIRIDTSEVSSDNPLDL